MIQYDLYLQSWCTKLRFIFYSRWSYLLLTQQIYASDFRIGYDTRYNENKVLSTSFELLEEKQDIRLTNKHLRVRQVSSPFKSYRKWMMCLCKLEYFCLKTYLDSTFLFYFLCVIIQSAMIQNFILDETLQEIYFLNSVVKIADEIKCKFGNTYPLCKSIHIVLLCNYI